MDTTQAPARRWARQMLWLAGGTALCLFALPAQAVDAIRLQTTSAHSRLIVEVDESVPVSWRDIPGGFEIRLKGVQALDLGAALGREAEWKKKVGRLTDGRLASLTVEENWEGITLRGKWKFPTGPNAPAQPTMLKFDYRDRTPPRYVVDFWPKKGPTRVQAEAARKEKERVAAIQLAEEKARMLGAARALASKAKSEAEDVTRFCRQTWNDNSDIFLEHTPYHEKVAFSRWFSVTTPDEQFIYFVPETKAPDAQYVRLALDLYKQGKTALVLRTLEFFFKEHPKSDFAAEMSFLRANALLKLGMADEAHRQLKTLMVEAKGKPVALLSGIYMAVRQFEKGAHLAALENFLWLITHHPDHRHAWVFHLGAAETLYALKQTDRAAKEYQWVVENAPDAASQAEAALRIGDLYLARVQHDRALAAYFQALQGYGEQAKKFPAIHVNRAEALYWLGKFERAQLEFERVLAEFPGHPIGWRATLRLGEIHARLGKSDSFEKSREWFYETVNRYPFSPGATVARVRLVPCGDHGGFNMEAAERFFTNEASHFDSKGEIIVSPRYHDFVVLARVRTLVSFGREDLAIDVAVEQLGRDEDESDARRILGNSLETLFRKTIIGKLDAGQYVDAINFYKEKAKKIHSSSRKVDAQTLDSSDYLLRLSRAASDLGLTDLARQMATTYGDVESQVVSKDRKPASVAAEDIDARLRASEKSFVEAKLLWLKEGKGASKKVRELMGLIIDESQLSYDREILLGLVDEAAGDLKSASQHAARAMLLSSGNDDRRLVFWASTLMAGAGEIDSALELLRRARAMKDEPPATAPSVVLGVRPVPQPRELHVLEAEILAKAGRWGDVARAYEVATEKGFSDHQILYQMAQALDRSGEEVRSTEVLERIAKDKKPDFWSKLAREALATREQSRKSQGGP